MGQYHIPVNLTKREYVDPHKLGCGLKQWEQLANHPGTGSALLILLACSNGRGGGDFDVDENWHGPERIFPKHNASPGPMPEDYRDIAARTIGRWAGDQLALVGDYAEDSDLAEEHRASMIYALCSSPEEYQHNAKWFRDNHIDEKDLYTDITDDVCRVIEHELQGKYEDEGWRRFVFDRDRE